MAVQEALATPAIALILGALLGIGLLLPVMFGYRFREQTDIGLAIVMGSVLLGLFLAVGVLFVYQLISPTGVVWFGPALVGGFFIALVFFAIRVTMLMLKSDDKTRR